MIERFLVLDNFGNHKRYQSHIIGSVSSKKGLDDRFVHIYSENKLLPYRRCFDEIKFLFGIIETSLMKILTNT